MAHGAVFKIIRRFYDKPFMGCLLTGPFFISFVAELASHAEMWIFLEEVLVNKVPLIHQLRLN